MDNTPAFGALNYTILFTYLAVIFAIGLKLAGKQKTADDYFLAGRRMPWLIVAMSMFASLSSAVSYMGVPGIAYKENISLIFIGFLSPIVAIFLILLFYPLYRKLNVTTSYEYIGHRYNRNARFTVSGLFILARLGWLGVVIYAPALTLSVVTGVNIWLAIGLMGTLAVGYTTLGGLSAVLWTDVIQFVILTGGASYVAVSLLLNVPGGFMGILDIAEKTQHLDSFEWRIDIYHMNALAVCISYFLQIMQDYGVDQISVQRLMSVKSFRGTVKAIVLNSFFDLFMISLLLFLGIAMFAYFHHFPQRLAEGISPDRILPYYIMFALPAGVSGVLITAIFAAAMSSLDSGIHSLSTVIINDFVKPLRRKPSTEAHDVKLARILTFVVGVFAILVACYVSTMGQILKASSSFLGLFSGPVLAIFLLGILTRRANYPGWLMGTVIAIVATLYFQYGLKAHWIYYFPFCFGISFVVGYIASLMFSRPKAAAKLTLWGRAKL